MIKKLVLLLLSTTVVMGRIHNTTDDEDLGRALDATGSVFELGEPVYFGSGCPDDSVEIVWATDGQTVSVLFSEYIAETASDKKRDRKSCNLAVPVDVKQGISIGIFKMDYRGNAYVPRSGRRSKAKFSTEYFFAGMRGPRAVREFNTGFDNDFTISHRLQVGAIVWSPCGASTNFRINTSLIAQKSRSNDEDVSIAMDSTEMKVEKYFRYYFSYRKC